MKSQDVHPSSGGGILCAICRQSLENATSILFCPNCGNAVFKNAVFYNKSKSTSQYDPFGRYSKPWKEKPLVKVRAYANSSSDKPRAWYPTMRQPRRPKTDVIKVKLTQQHPPAEKDDEYSDIVSFHNSELESVGSNVELISAEATMMSAGSPHTTQKVLHSKSLSIRFVWLNISGWLVGWLAGWLAD
jgi:hypothetical protein